MLTVCIPALAQNEAYTRYAYVKTVMNGKETRSPMGQDKKFKFSGNKLYYTDAFSEELRNIASSSGMNGGCTLYGKYAGQQDGNLIYPVYSYGSQISAVISRPAVEQPVVGQYFVVSSDRTCINLVYTDNAGNVTMVEVYTIPKGPNGTLIR